LERAAHWQVLRREIAVVLGDRPLHEHLLFFAGGRVGTRLEDEDGSPADAMSGRVHDFAVQTSGLGAAVWGRLREYLADDQEHAEEEDRLFHVAKLICGNRSILDLRANGKKMR